MKTATIKSLLEDPQIGNEVIVMGWVRTFRSNRFIAINDGSTLQNLQCVIDFENTDEKLLKEINTGACLKLTGKLEESQGKGQSVEVQEQLQGRDQHERMALHHHAEHLHQQLQA